VGCWSVAAPLGVGAEQTVAIIGAEQEGEPVEVGTQVDEIVGSALREGVQRLA
jgi:hypothetical protein